MPKPTRKRRNVAPQGQQKERNNKNQGRNKCKRNKGDHSQINKAKSWFFQKIKKKKNRQTISQTHQDTKGEESNRKSRNENGDITRDNTQIQRIIRDYDQQQYANKGTTWKKWINSQKSITLQN